MRRNRWKEVHVTDQISYIRQLTDCTTTSVLLLASMRPSTASIRLYLGPTTDQTPGPVRQDLSRSHTESSLRWNSTEEVYS